MSQKICKKCDILKGEDNFYFTAKGSRVNTCKECKVRLAKDRRHLQNPNIRPMRQQRLGWNPSIEELRVDRRQRSTKRVYGLSESDIDLLLKEQYETCLICFKPFDLNSLRPYTVDHCHKTDTVRGLLCSNCNLGLGNIYDSTIRAIKLIQYLSIAVDRDFRFIEVQKTKKSPSSPRVNKRYWAIYTKYKLSRNQVDKILEIQDYSCASCETLFDIDSKNAYHVDHCHDTGAIRGFLCRSCNVALGHFQENPMIILNAIRYLERSAVTS